MLIFIVTIENKVTGHIIKVHLLTLDQLVCDNESQEKCDYCVAVALLQKLVATIMLSMMSIFGLHYNLPDHVKPQLYDFAATWLVGIP